MLQQILQNFSFARRLKYEKLLPFLVNRGDLLSSGIAKAFSFYNPLKWALFSRNRSNVGCKEKEKGGAWPLLNSIAVLCVSNFITLHLHTVLKIHFWSTNSFLAKTPKNDFLGWLTFYNLGWILQISKIECRFCQRVNSSADGRPNSTGMLSPINSVEN